MAEQLELSGRRDASLVGVDMMADAVSSRLRVARLDESTTKANGGGKGGEQDRRR